MESRYQFDNKYEQIAVSKLRKAPYNVREDGQDKDMESLVRSIKNQGILQPLVVKALDEKGEQYEIIIGNRRAEAARKASLEVVPCRVISANPSTAELISIVENVQRLNYTPLERARVVQKLSEQFNGDKEQTAHALGFKGAQVITDWLAPLEVDPQALSILKPVAGQTVNKRIRLLATVPRFNQRTTAEILNEKAVSEHDAKTIVAAIRQNPGEDPRTVVERTMLLPKPVGIHVELTPDVNRALELAAVQQNVTKAKLGEIAIESYLREKGYLK